MRNKDYVDSFADYLLEEEKSIGTIEGYKADVNAFLSFANKTIKNVKRTDIDAYKQHLRAKGLKTSTINRKLVSVKQFISFLNERFELGISTKVRQEKIQRQYSLKDEELLTYEDYEKLLNVINEAGDIRAKAMVETMYYSGMRVSEMLQLRVDHVKSSLKVIEDIKGKGGKYREIFISDKLLKTLQEYLEVREQPFSSNTKKLFVSQKGEATRQLVHNIMKKYAKLAGIEEEKAHAHNCRHLFGLRLAERKVPIEDIAKYMGHSSIETTRIYLEKTQSHYAEQINNIL